MAFLDEDEAALDDDEDEMENLLPVDGKVGAKKLRKLQEKEEKRKQREVYTLLLLQRAQILCFKIKFSI